MLVQKHLSKLHHWQQVLEEVSPQHRKPSDLPPPGPLTFLEQASANLPPAPLKPNQLSKGLVLLAESSNSYSQLCFSETVSSVLVCVNMPVSIFFTEYIKNKNGQKFEFVGFTLKHQLYFS